MNSSLYRSLFDPTSPEYRQAMCDELNARGGFVWTPKDEPRPAFDLAGWTLPAGARPS